MNTVNTSVGAIIPLPLVIPNNNEKAELINLVKRIIEKQKEDPDYEYQNNEQIKIDRLIFKLYGLDEDLLKEVEDWYDRRYPKLTLKNPEIPEIDNQELEYGVV